MVSKTRYEVVVDGEDHDKLLSAPEDVDEQQAGHDVEKSWNVQGPRQRSKRGIIHTLKEHRWLLDTSLLLVIVALLVLLLQERRSRVTNGSWQVGGDFTGAERQFPTKVVKWNSDPSFAPANTSEFFSDDVLKRWQSLIPPNYGFAKAGDSFSTTSMTHQLHCVYMMARIYAGITSNNTANFATDYHEHYMHCVDYLRQGIMCAGDMAMEYHDPSDGEDLGPTDGGWSGHHVCKDYPQMVDFLGEQIKDGVRVVLPIDD